MLAAEPQLKWLAGQHDRMVDLLIRWANINSGSGNVAGLERMLSELTNAFAPLDGSVEILELQPHKTVNLEGRIVEMPLGEAVFVRKRPRAPVKVFLCIHMDTVYPADHPFQTCTRIDENRLQGPGVADAKGGILIMLKALEALERSRWAERIGWEVLVSPDEELGSPGSAPILADAATRNHVGLIFEPALPVGSVVGARKGSGNFVAVVRGRSAHAGRDPASARRAPARNRSS